MNWSIGFGSKRFGDGALPWTWLIVGWARVGFFFLSLKKLIRNFELTLKKLIQTNQIQELEHIG